MDCTYRKKEIINNRIIAKWESQYKGAWIVFCVLKAYENENGVVFVTYNDLAGTTYFSRETIRKILRTLEENKVLKKYHKQGSRTCIYIIHEENLN